ncbi:hypothetical protein RRG08_036947 [Elysia crispata]|uniref:Uncharacterized protein n=1 Tax=Elysia crispata TaxID=231223 RepID=A0AAE0YXX6_9GAST|nr:hypothetical protein RRG08_036947 [Elysia crispata]
MSTRQGDLPKVHCELDHSFSPATSCILKSEKEFWKLRDKVIWLTGFENPLTIFLFMIMVVFFAWATAFGFYRQMRDYTGGGTPMELSRITSSEWRGF